MMTSKRLELMRSLILAVHREGGSVTSQLTIELIDEYERERKGRMVEWREIEDALAPALGYEESPDPGYGRWVTGDHTSVTLALEAARRIRELEERLQK